MTYGVCRFLDCNILPKQMLTLWADSEWLGPERRYGGPAASRAAAIHAYHPGSHRAGTSNYSCLLLPIGGDNSPSIQLTLASCLGISQLMTFKRIGFPSRRWQNPTLL